MNIKRIISWVLASGIVSGCNISVANAENQNSIITGIKCGMAESEVIEILGNDIVYTLDSSDINPEDDDYTNFYNTENISDFNVDMSSVIITEFSGDNTLNNYGYNIGTHYNKETQKFEYPYSESELLEVYDGIYNQLVQWYGEGGDGYNIYGTLREYTWNTEYGEIWFVVGTDLFGESSGINKIILTCSANPEDNKKLGDVNGDGVINSSDASDILADYAVTSSGGVSILDKDIADVNKDKQTDSSDSSLILAYYAYISAGGNATIQKFKYI